MPRSGAHLCRHQRRQHRKLGFAAADGVDSIGDSLRDHSRRSGLHRRMAEIEPCGGMRDDWPTAIERLQDHSSGRHALCGPFVAFNRRDDVQSEFVNRSFSLKQVSLNQIYVPSSEGKLRAVLAGWGVGVIPELLARESLKKGSLVDLTPGEDFRVRLYWHCWNIESDVLESLTNALVISAAKALV